MDLAISTKTFNCTICDGLAHIVLNQPDRGNPIDGEFCREFSLCIAELSERADVRSVLLSARGRLFSVVPITEDAPHEAEGRANGRKDVPRPEMVARSSSS